MIQFRPPPFVERQCSLQQPANLHCRSLQLLQSISTLLCVAAAQGERDNAGILHDDADPGTQVRNEFGGVFVHAMHKAWLPEQVHSHLFTKV